MTVTLRAGPYLARISRIGAAVEALTRDERPLLFALPEVEPTPRFRGVVLVPWPNRIAEGRYDFDGRTHQLPITEPERHNALHGLAVHQQWEIANQQDNAVVLRTVVAAQPGYPFPLEVEAGYALDADAGLTVWVRTTNTGTVAAPYGTSIHPYLCADDGAVDDWVFTVDAAQVLGVDAERLLPTAVQPVDGTIFDFRAAARVGDRVIDHALTGLTPDPDGRFRATLTAPDGGGVQLTWDATCPWLQVHTTDLPGRPVHRRGLAVEPMTCAPDAFNSGRGLLRLAAGATHTTGWTISAVTRVN